MDKTLTAIFINPAPAGAILHKCQTEEPLDREVYLNGGMLIGLYRLSRVDLSTEVPEWPDGILLYA